MAKYFCLRGALGARVITILLLHLSPAALEPQENDATLCLLCPNQRPMTVGKDPGC